MQQGVNGREMRAQHPAVCIDAGQGFFRHGNVVRLVSEQGQQGSYEFLHSCHLPGASRLHQGCGNLTEIVHVRAKKHRHATGRRFEGIVPSLATKLPPTKATVARP